MSRFMPPEWATHSATWMGFPVGAYPGAGVNDDEVQQAWAAVANIIVDHEPVHMLCPRAQWSRAKRLVSASVVLHEYPLNDAWLRDTGPTFVVENDNLTAVDWRFNGWGDHTAFDWQEDAAIAAFIAQQQGVTHRSSNLTNEGGGIHVDGAGTVLLTETVQLDSQRNPNWSKAQVESEIHAQLGTDRAVWLPRGLHRDYSDHGTRGHVDIVACFTPSGSVLLHQQPNQQHPDYPLYAIVHELLADAGYPVRPMQAPTVLRDNRDWVDYSYINHYLCNGAVVMPTFKDPMDDVAADLLKDSYTDRDVRRVDARVIFAMGGGVHCITQQQPALAA